MPIVRVAFVNTVFKVFDVTNRGISDIFAIIDPPQIFHAVVVSDPVDMVHLVLALHRGYKCFRNQTMNPVILPPNPNNAITFCVFGFIPRNPPRFPSMSRMYFV